MDKSKIFSEQQEEGVAEAASAAETAAAVQAAVGAGEVWTRLEYAEFEGEGEEEGTPIGKRKRTHSITGESPEEGTGRIHKQPREGGGAQRYLRKKILDAVAEMREYVRNDFNKANKETRMKYFEKRFASIEEKALLLDTEYRRAWSMAERIGLVERNFDRMVKRDWGSELTKETEAEVTRATIIMAEQARQIMDETVGRMARKVEEVMATSQHAEEERERAAREAETASRKKLESVMGIVGGLERRLDSVERFMDEVRSNMDKTFVEVQQVGKSVRDDLRGIVDCERRTEGQVSRLAEYLDVERISMGVADAKKVMEEVAGVIGSAARRVERMETDEEEEGGTFAQVLRGKKKSRRGPTVVLEAREEGRQVTREQVVKCLDPKKGEVRVKGLRRKGKDFVIEVHAEEDLEKLRRSEALEEIGLKVDGVAKLRWPRVFVHDVDREIEREDLLEAILRRNAEVLGGLEMERVRQEFIPEFVEVGGICRSDLGLFESVQRSIRG